MSKQYFENDLFRNQMLFHSNLDMVQQPIVAILLLSNFDVLIDEAPTIQNQVLMPIISNLNKA